MAAYVLQVFAEKMGLETGWNCHISLTPNGDMPGSEIPPSSPSHAGSLHDDLNQGEGRGFPSWGPQLGTASCLAPPRMYTLERGPDIRVGNNRKSVKLQAGQARVVPQRLAEMRDRLLFPQRLEMMQKACFSWRRRATQISSASSPQTATSPASWRTATGYKGRVCHLYP